MSKALETTARVADPNQFSEHTECSVCLTEFAETDIVTPLPCDPRHYFHTKCIKKWAVQRLRCPLCQVPFTVELIEATQVKSAMSQSKNLVNESSKQTFASLPESEQPLVAQNEP